MGVSENVVYPIVPNGFADHYPYEKWLFHWEYTLFSTDGSSNHRLLQLGPAMSWIHSPSDVLTDGWRWF